MSNTCIETAFVSSNSLCQGESVNLLWELLSKEGVFINFAHTTFLWTSEAKENAAVMCVILGFSKVERKRKLLYTDKQYKIVEHINGYLKDAPDVFIKAARLIKEQIPESFFIIVGDGEQRDVIEEYAQKYNFYNSLKITGWVENALDYVDLFDVAMLLSRWEGFGLALPEYMLAGKPIVASNVDAIPSIIDDGQNGLLVEADNAEQASVAVIRLFKDSELRTALTKQGSITVHEKYDAKRVSLENEYIILSILH